MFGWTDGEKGKVDKGKGDRAKTEDFKAADKLKAGSAEKHKKSLGKMQGAGDKVASANGDDKSKSASGDKAKLSSEKVSKPLKVKGEFKVGREGEKSDSMVVSGSEKEDEGGGQDGAEWREGADLEAAIAFLKQQKKAALLLRRTDQGDGEGGETGAGKKNEEEDEDEEEDLRWMRGSGGDPSNEGDAAAHRAGGGREGGSTLLHSFTGSGLFPRAGGEAEDGLHGLDALQLDEGLKYVVLLLMQEGIYARKLQVRGC